MVETFILVFFVGVLKKWYWKLVPFMVAFYWPKPTCELKHPGFSRRLEFVRHDADLFYEFNGLYPN